MINFFKKIKKTAKQESGQSMVELALILPFFLLVICGMIDYGYVFYQQNAITSMTSGAARYAAIAYGTSYKDGEVQMSQRELEDTVKSYIRQRNSEASMEVKVKSVEVVDIEDLECITVELEQETKYLTGLTGILRLGNNTVVLKSKSTMPVEPYKENEEENEDEENEDEDEEELYSYFISCRDKTDPENILKVIEGEVAKDETIEETAPDIPGYEPEIETINFVVNKNNKTETIWYVPTSEYNTPDPSETEPHESEPAESDPIESDPAETEPTETDPVESNPAESETVIYRYTVHYKDTTGNTIKDSDYGEAQEGKEITIKPKAISGYVCSESAITFTLHEDVEYTFTYEVKIPTIKINKNTLTLNKGSGERLSVTTTNADGLSYTWTSSNTDVVTVDKYGKVKAIAAGTANVTATLNGTTYSDTCVVTVKDGDIIYVELTETSSWGDGVHACNIIIKNNGDVALSNWQLAVDLPYSINGISLYGGFDTTTSGKTLTISPISWSSCLTLKPGDNDANQGQITMSGTSGKSLTGTYPARIIKSTNA